MVYSELNAYRWKVTHYLEAGLNVVLAAGISLDNLNRHARMQCQVS